MIYNVLEIFVITYNRSALLEKTLNTLLSDNSPVKTCDIICLDNNSTDNTYEVVSRFKTNIKYIKNNRNIGLMGNFARCVELCRKKYMWILCDNDEINFTYFHEVINYINEGYTLINVSTVIPKDPSKIETILAQSVFLPAMIYSTKYINDTIMSHIMCNIYTVFAQCTLCSLIYNKSFNNEKIIACTSHDIINYTHNIKIDNIDEYNVDRVQDDPYIPAPLNFKSNNQYASVIHSFSVLQDKKIYNNLMKYICKHYLSYKYISKKLLHNNKIHKSDKKLFIWFLMSIGFKQKIIMLTTLIRIKIQLTLESIASYIMCYNKYISKTDTNKK